MPGSHFEFHVEDRSMEAFLAAWLPRVLPRGCTFGIYPYPGKTASRSFAMQLPRQPLEIDLIGCRPDRVRLARLARLARSGGCPWPRHRTRHAGMPEAHGQSQGGGGGGIRTHGGLSSTPVFKTGAFDHSATPPGRQLPRTGSPRHGTQQRVYGQAAGNVRERSEPAEDRARTVGGPYPLAASPSSSAVSTGASLSSAPSVSSVIT